MEVKYTIRQLTPTTEFISDWNWQSQAQATGSTPVSIITKYTCKYVANITLQLVIWNDASNFTRTLNIMVEADLALDISLSVTYTPHVTPLDVTLNIYPLRTPIEGTHIESICVDL